MTLDEAAEKYKYSFFSPARRESPANEKPGVGPTQIEEHFKAGAEWAVKNDPRVLEFVEALERYAARPFIDAVAKDAISKWKSTP